MRRALMAALAALCIASPSHARIGIVRNTPISTSTAARAEISDHYEAAFNKTIQTINSMGGAGNYVIINQKDIATEYFRTGIMVWPNGAAEQLDGWIYPEFVGSNANGCYATARCRADSVTRVALGGPQVPQLFTIGDEYALTGGTAFFSTTASLRCSTGVAENTVQTNPPIAQGVYVTGDPSTRWLIHIYTNGFSVGGMVVPGGIRRLLSMTDCGMGIVGDGQQLGANINPQWPDSMPGLGGGAGGDTTLVWDRLWANIASCPTAKTQTFCQWGGGGLLVDSLNNADGATYPVRNGDNELNIQVLAFALAHFDSLCGGKLFTHGAQRRAFVVKGGLSRGQRWQRGGICSPDTTTFYNTLDSIAYYRIPLTFTINPDSATAYARDLIKLKACPTLRFAAEVRDGVYDTTTAGLGATNGGRLVDVWGRNRRRAFFGDSLAHTVQTSDTSLVWGLRRQRAMVDSLTGNRSVAFAVPPADDWLPKQLGSAGAAASYDSLLWAINRAGYVGVLTDGQWDQGSISTNKGPGYTNPIGFYREQRYATPSIAGTTGYPVPIRILAHQGSSPGMGQAFQGVFDDSSGARTKGQYTYAYHELDRTYGAFFREINKTQDSWSPFLSDFISPYSQVTKYDGIQCDVRDAIRYPRKGYAGRLYCSDLSGRTVNPARSGWWVIKSTWMNFKAINDAHGVYGPIVLLDYLDNVTP